MEPVAYREQIYEIFGEPTEPLEDEVEAALEVGTQYLDLPIGFATKIEDGVQEILFSKGDHPLLRPGETCPLDNAYCRRTIQMDKPLAVQRAGASTDISESAVETFDLQAYVGAKIVVDGETYGTVCFASERGRGQAYSDAELFFVELIARLVGQAIERRTYERELAEREAQLDERKEIYRAIIDASFDLVFRVDMEGLFTYLSPAVEELLGYPPSEYLGERFTHMLPDEDTAALGGEIFEQVVNGATVEEEYFPLQSKAEGRVYVDVRVTPIYRSDVPEGARTTADIVGVQGTARNATDRKRRERLITVLNRVLRHNLRNDTNAISGYADMLAERLAGDDAEIAERIVDMTAGLVALSETARELERNLTATPELEALDVMPIVSRATARIAARYPDAVIEVDAPDRAMASCTGRLETAVSELLDNAAKHAGDRPSIELTVRTEGERVVIRIEDDGPGLPDQERSVLESGEETPLVHGSGLGLWLVSWIVESLNGELRVLDAESGASIEVRLHAGTAE